MVTMLLTVNADSDMRTAWTKRGVKTASGQGT